MTPERGRFLRRAKPPALLGACLTLQAVAFLLVPSRLEAGEEAVQVAVAANFSEPMRAIAEAFQAETGYQVTISIGSTGKHYAQIRNGAPFSIFFAADSERPRLLEAQGLGIAGTRFTYAVGRLVLWSPDPGLVDSRGNVLETGRFTHLAIANPKVAPYGTAARQVLEARGLWHTLSGKLVRGQSVGQAYQFLVTGNAELGFLSLSQLVGPNRSPSGSWWLVPENLYTPIAQQVILLRDNPAARALLSFVKGPTGRRIISSYGYALEGGEDAAP